MKPKNKELKEIMLKIRINEETNFQLKVLAKAFGLTMSETVRWLIHEKFNERKKNMYSFKTTDGENVPFEAIHDISLDEQTDVETEEITAYLVNYNDHIYEISESTYNALRKKGVR